MTPKQQEKYAAFCEHIAEFEDLLRKQTGIVTLARDGLEADDLMAGVAQLFHETHDIIIISADKDLMQLLRYPSVVLIDPATGKPRTLVDHEMDADLFMFVKCIRGDAGDNVQSAFPRVRMTRIKEAYTDPYARANLMNETWTDETGRELKVKDLFAENELLMDLAKQPPEIREAIEDGVLEGFDNKGTFNHFHFLRFCGKFGLVNISNSLENFVKMLT
ncbi:5'-3' exonuclease [compost metagenome]